MKGWLAAAALVCLFGCESVTTGTNAPWGPIDGVNFVPADAFFLESVQPNGDYNLVLIVADRTGYCPILQQNLSGYPSNITYALFTFSNPIGSGAVNPPPGTYPITASYGSAPSAQASYGTVSASCVASEPLAGTSGSVVMSRLASDVSSMTGSVDVGFGSAGTLSGNFAALLCDTSAADAGPSQCYQ
jgi:hypothetical protein